MTSTATAAAASGCGSLTLNATCLTKAEVYKGTSVANFPIRLPRFAGSAELNTNCIGFPVSIRTKPVRPGGTKEVQYAASVSVGHDTNTYPFQMKNIYAPKKTVEEVVAAFQDHIDACSRVYPLMSELPTLVLEADAWDEMGETATLSLNMPPKSSLYTTFVHLFPSMGFDFKEMRSEEIVIGGRGSSVGKKVVFGFFNDSKEKRTFKSKIPMTWAMTMDFLWKETATRTKDPPERVQFQVEMNNWIGESVILMELLSFSREDVIQGLDSLMAAISKRMNFYINMIEITAAGPRERTNIDISNRVLRSAREMTDPKTAEYISRMSIELGYELKRHLGISSNDKLMFSTDVERNYSFILQDTTADPFDSKYPVTMVSRGYGPSINYFVGLGYVPVFGMMTEDSSKRYIVPVVSDGFIYNSDHTRLSIEFYDKAMNLIQFEEDTDMYLMMKFKRCL
jgi:hypothetical protein